MAFPRIVKDARAARERGALPTLCLCSVAGLAASAHRHRVAASRPCEEALRFAQLNPSRWDSVSFPGHTDRQLSQSTSRTHVRARDLLQVIPSTDRSSDSDVRGNRQLSCASGIATLLGAKTSPASQLFRILLYESRGALLGKGGMVTSQGLAALPTQVPWGYSSCAV